MKAKKIMKIITLIEIVALLTVSSYSWFSDKSNPTISENAIRVTTAEGLVMRLQPDSPARLNVELNEIIGQYDQFELKQISSADANDFYYIDFGQGLAQGDPTFVKVLPELDGSIDMARYGYIDFTFYLAAENFAKHVYLHKDTGYTGDASIALRIAISTTIGEVTTTRIFGDVAEDGGTNAYTTKAIIKEGTFNYYSIDPTFYTNQNVQLISSRNGGRGTSDDAFIDQGKLLCNIAANTAVKVRVRVWLEGGDIDCDADISSSLVDLLIKFGSANILLDAPNVTANNATHTITGLTTAMQYASTNTPSTSWTDVTNASMTFGVAETVYIRIAPVTNTTPESYAKTVIFS